MRTKLLEHTVQNIKNDLLIEQNIYKIARKYNISSGTAYKIKNNRYLVKEKNIKEKVKIDTTLQAIISRFKLSRSKAIETLEYIIKNKRVTIYTDCYSNKFKIFEVEFTTRYTNIFYFKDIKNNRILCFKFGDFLAQNIKVIK